MSVYRIKRGDFGFPITATLADENALDLTGASVRFKMKPAPESDVVATPVNGIAVVADAASGKVQYVWQSGDTAVAGAYVAEWEVTLQGGGVETFPSEGYIDVLVLPDV